MEKQSRLERAAETEIAVDHVRERGQPSYMDLGHVQDVSLELNLQKLRDKMVDEGDPNTD